MAHLVSRALPFRVGHRPQLKVLDAVVRAIPVDVVNHFARSERPAALPECGHLSCRSPERGQEGPAFHEHGAT